jgi:DNA repair protein RadC
MLELRVLRDELRPYAQCPNCQARLEIPSLDGLQWTVRSPRDVADRLIVQMGHLEQEELAIVVLNSKSVVQLMTTVYRGNVSASLVRVGELFRDAVRLNAAGVILVHNHPSGDPTPSPDDLHLTAEALGAGRLLDIDLLDHLVIGRDTYVSLRDRGVLFDRRGSSPLDAMLRP